MSDRSPEAAPPCLPVRHGGRRLLEEFGLPAEVIRGVVLRADTMGEDGVAYLRERGF